MTRTPGPSQDQLFVEDERLKRLRNSATWAAYADALGFISELVDERWLGRRTGGKPLTDLIPWRRRVGGRSGVEVVLPAGCWSDDTQLRLAVSRSITSNGFDVESFARVELPVWPSYALGGGRASKAAAASLARPDALWYANTFPGWTQAGGNGAAMRAQPHAWASRSAEDVPLSDVIADAVCTHGHPRAIVGACFHAMVVHRTVREGIVPSLPVLHEIVGALEMAFPRFLDEHPASGTWVKLWEEAEQRPFGAAWTATLEEAAVALDAGDRAFAGGDPSVAYGQMVSALDLRSPELRGSGVLTVVAASLAALHSASTADAVVTIVNELGTDTDTIATMSAAVMGAARSEEVPPQEPLDAQYLRSEADRLHAISRGDATEHHSYPDLLTWSAPQTQADALVLDEDGAPSVEGLGRAAELDSELFTTGRGAFCWQWVQTTPGQTLLIKRRQKLKRRPAGNSMAPPAPPPVSARRTPRPVEPAPPESTGTPRDRGVNVDTAVQYARDHLGDDRKLGYTVRRVARDGTIGDLVALVVELRDDLRR